MKLFYITEEDAPVLAQILADYRRRNRTLDMDPSYVLDEEDADDIFTPEVYVAEIPDAGIPAATQTGSTVLPGSATCDIYKLSPSTGTGTGTGEMQLEAAEFNQTVYNISQTVITGDYKIAWRDKFGDWVVEVCPCTTNLV